MSDFPAALEHAKRGASAANASGWSKGMAAGAANCAYFCLRLGEIDEAQKYLADVDRQRYISVNYQLAVTETRSQLEWLRGSHAAALQLLEEHRELAPRAFSWYRIAVTETEVRVHTASGNFKAAIAKADLALATAAKHGMTVFVPNLQVRRAIAICKSGSGLSQGDVLAADNTTPTLENTALVWALRAIACKDAATAATYSSRAVRICETTGDHVGASEACNLAGGEPQNTVALPNLETAAALIDLAGHPHVLARELLAVIAGSGCARGAAIVARGAKDVRVLETRDWSDGDALRAARKAVPSETIDCGTHRDELLQVIAAPHEDLERRSTWSAIRKLTASAVLLDRYRREEKQRAALWPTALDGESEGIWVSEQSTELLRVARRIAPTGLSVLITGESGTGKEVMARAIHAASDRAGKALLGFNCTAVPRDMFESQLFGYRKGAFTGAESTFSGIIRASEGGTLFLDEIADVPPEVQPKLLRFLETHEIHPLGEPRPIKVDVRVLAATNIDLERLVAEGRFREDLFYRLNVVRLRLPPLRERREEIPALVEHYVRKFGDQQKKGRLTLSDEALEYLLLYPWPGNIRQLANEVNRMVAMAEPDTNLTAIHLSAEIQATRKTVPASTALSSELRISLDQSLPDAVEFLERTMVEAALNRTNGRLEEAAKILGISRKGLFLKRRRWGMQQAL